MIPRERADLKAPESCVGGGYLLGLPAWHENWPDVRNAGLLQREAAPPDPQRRPLSVIGNAQMSALVSSAIFLNISNALFLLRAFLSSQDNSVPTTVVGHFLFTQQIIGEQLLCARHYSRNRSAEFVKWLKSLLSCNIHSSWGYRQMIEDKECASDVTAVDKQSWRRG